MAAAKPHRTHALPDYDEWRSGWSEQRPGAPVGPDGQPVYYHAPVRFELAKNDGERWRWALVQAAEADPGQLNSGRIELANFLLGQFGVQTLAERGWTVPADGNDGNQAGPYALETLRDDETIACLATGVKRFTLADLFNPIKLYQQIANEPQTGHGEDALDQLASVFENRRQLDRAAEMLRRSKEGYGDQSGSKAQQLDQIVGAWGQFEPNMTQPAGRGATVDFRYRNGRRVQFQAREILFTKLLADVKSYIASAPDRIDWQKVDLSNIGNRLVVLNQRQYVGRLVAQWDLDLDPRPGHLDRRTTVNTPLQKAGAYLLSAKIDGGNTSQIVVWLDDTVIVKKTMEQKAYHFVADSRTGQPIPAANLDLFGWRMVQIPGKNQYQMETKTLSVKTDDEGQAMVPTTGLNDDKGSFQWLTMATTPEGRLRPGFTPIWGASNVDPEYNQQRVYLITDRPVYRPGQPVRFKFWVAHARYDQPDAFDFAHQRFTVEIRNPKGEKLLTKEFTADAFGGFDGSIELPSDAALGVYQVFIPNRGGGSFRVEEYKKPEFEVKVDAPGKPVMLGEKVTATIKAKYFFGSPVAEAKVKYKITRTSANARWYPLGALGLALRSRLLVVRRRFFLVSRLVAVGHGPPQSLVVEQSPGSSGSRGRSRGAHPARTARLPSRSTPRSRSWRTPITITATRSRPRSPTSPAG